MVLKAPHLPSGTSLPCFGSLGNHVLQVAELQDECGLDSCSPVGRELPGQLADLDFDKQELLLSYRDLGVSLFLQHNPFFLTNTKPRSSCLII